MTKNVKAYTIVASVPAKFIRNRFDTEMNKEKEAKVNQDSTDDLISNQTFLSSLLFFQINKNE